MTRKRKRGAGEGESPPPREITMTDLEAGQEDRGAHGRADIHAAGTPGGGTAVGGLAGTNVGDGSPDDVVRGTPRDPSTFADEVLAG